MIEDEISGMLSKMMSQTSNQAWEQNRLPSISLDDSDLSLDNLLESTDTTHDYGEYNGDIPSLSSFGDHDELREHMENYYKEKESLAAKKNSSIHERLYKEGEIVATMRAKAYQIKKQEEMQTVPQKLQLSTRSYTPLRARAQSDEKTHDRLYKSDLQKKKQAIAEEAKMEAYKIKYSPKQNAIDPSKSASRLYARSEKYREEGKKIRETIEKKLHGRDPTPSRSISVSRAQQIYERGLRFKAEREKKIQEMYNAPRESSFPKLPTQTPVKREKFYEARDDTSFRSRSSSVDSRRSGANSTYRKYVRSETPTRLRSNSRSATPVRRGDRSMTPSRRLSDSTIYSSQKQKASPRLPRSFKINRSDS